jgi:hypothetical protein
MAGLTFRRTEQKDGKSVEIAGSDHEVRSGLIVSSIGSVPEVVQGVPVKGELYDYTSWETGALRGLPGVFGLGNVLTGKGNIKDSRENAEEISNAVIREYLGLEDAPGDAGLTSAAMQDAHQAARVASQVAVESAIRRAKIAPPRLQQIAELVERRWNEVGYDGNYSAWIGKHAPDA